MKTIIIAGQYVSSDLYLALSTANNAKEAEEAFEYYGQEIPKEKRNQIWQQVPMQKRRKGGL